MYPAGRARPRSGGDGAWSRRAILVLLLLALLTASGSTWARKRVRPLPRAEVATTWLGISSDELYRVRLTLLPDGTGVGAFTFADDPARVFTISEWNYDDAGRITIQAVPPPGEPSWVRPMNGIQVGLRLELRAKGEDWKLSFILWREAEVLEHWNRLREAMEG